MALKPLWQRCADFGVSGRSKQYALNMAALAHRRAQPAGILGEAFTEARRRIKAHVSYRMQLSQVFAMDMRDIAQPKVPLNKVMRRSVHVLRPAPPRTLSRLYWS